jgi:hypothetical protein
MVVTNQVVVISKPQVLSAVLTLLQILKSISLRSTLECNHKPITAKTKKLKAVWTPEFAQDLAAYQNIDAEAELTNIMSEYISMEIDLEILDMLIEDAAAATEYWSAVNNTVYNP